MIVYEVNLRVQRTIEAEYRAWLAHHVAQMLQLPGFEAASTFVVPEADDEASIALCVQYRVRDAAALERYLAEDAPRMRGDGIARFGARFSAGRRVLVPVDA